MPAAADGARLYIFRVWHMQMNKILFFLVTQIEVNNALTEKGRLSGAPVSKQMFEQISIISHSFLNFV